MMGIELKGLCFTELTAGVSLWEEELLLWVYCRCRQQRTAATQLV